MSQTPIERLKVYLGQLPPQSLALLMREYERAIECGEDVGVATFVLEELRKIVRASTSPGEEARPRAEDPARQLFLALGPFLVEGNGSVRPGQIRRASLLPIWQWLAREGAPQETVEFEAGFAAATTPGEVERVTRKFQIAAAEKMIKIATPVPGGEAPRGLSRIGPPHVGEDMIPIAAFFKARDSIDAFGSKLPSYMRDFGDAQSAAVNDALNIPSLVTPPVLPFVLSVVMQRLSASWQIIRLAIKMAASDDEIRVAATSYGVAVTMVIHDLSRVAANLRADIRRGHFDHVHEHLKILHDGVRGLRTELDIRNDSSWGRQLASIRVDISNSLQSEIDSVPGRVRRLLRQRADKDIITAARIDSADVEETAALIDFVAVCRTFASELAINEVTLRTYSDLQQYVEKSTESLVQSLRNGDAKVRAFRHDQVKAAIRFCDILFGQEYATLMSRAAENAMVVERKPAKASKVG
jgi:hypothetical protein